MDLSTLSAVLHARAGDTPDALAFTFGGEAMSYASLLDDSHRLAGAMLREGVRAGDRVALVLPAGLDVVRLFYAVQRLGAAASIFDPAVPAEARGRRVARIRPRLVVSDLAWAGSSAPLPPVPDDPDAVAFVQSTSGTSGEPRAAIVLQRHVMASLASTQESVDPSAADVFVGWVPPWHDLGLMRFLIAPVFFGAPSHLVTPAVRTIPQWFATIAERRGTITGAPDFAWRLATRLVDRGLDLSSLRFCTNGGEPVRASTITSFEERFRTPNVIRPGYGLAEATLGVTGLRIGDPMRVDARGNVSSGPANPGMEVRIEDGTGQILVRGPSLFAGYLDAEQDTAEALKDGWLHTGDAGALDADGHLYVLGRQRAMLKRGGAPLAPRELEEAAQSVPGVRIAAAVGIPSKTGAMTEEIVLVVEAGPGLTSIAADVARAVEAALGFAPDRVLVQEPRTIPRTSNGKIRHAVLRDSLL